MIQISDSSQRWEERDDWARGEIDHLYEHILDKLKGGTLYGVPMDATDMKWMVAAAYLTGENEMRVQHRQERQHIQELRRGERI